MRHLSRLLFFSSLVVFGACHSPASTETDPTEPTDPAVSPANSLSVEIADDVDWAAFRDGDGAWQVLVSQAAGDDSGQTTAFTEPITDADGRFAFAYVCDYVSGYVQAFYIYSTLTPVPGKTLPPVICNPYLPPPGEPAEPNPVSPPEHFKLTGEVKGVAEGEGGSVAVETASEEFYNRPIAKLAYGSGAGGRPFQFSAGNYDIMAVNGPLNVGPDIGTPNWGILVRAFPINGDTTRDLDFATEGFALSNFTVTLSGGKGKGRFKGELVFITKGGTSLRLNTLLGEEDSVTYPSFPAAATQAGDNHVLQLSIAQDTCHTDVTDVFRVPKDLTVLLPSCSLVNLAPAIYPEIGLEKVPETYLLDASFEQGRRIYTVAAHGAWLTHDSVRLPDLTNLEGWKSSWSIKPGSEVPWYAQLSSGSSVYKFDPPLKDGYHYESVSKNGSFIP